MIEIANRWIGRFAQIEEMTGTEECLITGAHCFGERASLLEPSQNELLEPNKCFLGDRLARGKIDETPQQSPCVFGRILGSNLGVDIVEQDSM